MSNEKQVEQLTNYMANFIAHIAKKLPDDVIAKLTELRDKEDSPLSKTIYDTMFENQRLAVELNRPSCQDTGVLQFWVKCGTKFPLIDELEGLLKEAVVKAFGTGFRKITPNEIEILRDESGAPYVLLYGRAKDKADQIGVKKILISLADTKTQAIAFVVLLG